MAKKDAGNAVIQELEAYIASQDIDGVVKGMVADALATKPPSLPAYLIRHLLTKGHTGSPGHVVIASSTTDQHGVHAAVACGSAEGQASLEAAGVGALLQDIVTILQKAVDVGEGPGRDLRAHVANSLLGRSS